MAVSNPRLYGDEEVREALKDCCYDRGLTGTGDLMYADFFKSRVKRFTEEHPELFVGVYGNIPFDAVKDPVMRANHRLEFLQKQMKIILRNLIGSEDEDQPSLTDEFDAVKDSIQGLSERLLRLFIVMCSGSAIVGLLIGYLLRVLTN